MRARGIDVSRYQTDLVNWNCMRDEGKSFALIRSSVGLRWDPYFSNNHRGTRRVGIIRGQYHCLQPSTKVNIDQQAVNFASSLLKCELSPILDVEVNGLVEEDVLDFLWMFENITDIKPIIYTNIESWHRIVGPGREWAKDYGLWVAHWRLHTNPDLNIDNAEPSLPSPWDESQSWMFWQYASLEGMTSCYPVGEKLDYDVFHGTEEELKALIG